MKLRPGWKRGVVGEYGDNGYAYGQWGLARMWTESDRPSRSAWNVFHNGKAVDTYRDTLLNLMLHIELLRR